MAYTTENLFSTANGNPPTAGQSLFSFTFPYLQRTEIAVSIDGSRLATTAYSFANDTTIQLDSTTAATITTASAVRLFRETNLEELKAEFFAGSAIRATDLNDNFNQALFVTQEVNDRYVDANNPTFAADVSLGGYKVVNLGDGVAATDAVNKGQLDATQNANDAALATAVTNAQTAQAAAETAKTGAETAATNANTSATTAGNHVTTAEGHADDAAASAAQASAFAGAAANFAADPVFFGIRRNVANGRTVLRVDYSEATNTTNVYDPLDYNYKGKSTSMIATNGMLHTSGSNVGEPKIAFATATDASRTSGHVYIQLHN